MDAPRATEAACSPETGSRGTEGGSARRDHGTLPVRVCFGCNTGNAMARRMDGAVSENPGL